MPHLPSNCHFDTAELLPLIRSSFYVRVSTKLLFLLKMADANFGLRSRGGRGNNRPAAASNPWTQVHNRNNQGIASAAHAPEQQT